MGEMVREVASDSELLLVKAAVMPRLRDLEATYVAALHESDLWFEYRLALTRALERMEQSRSLGKDASRRLLQEEMAVVESRVRETTKHSAFVQDRTSAVREIAIGALAVVPT